MVLRASLKSHLIIPSGTKPHCAVSDVAHARTSVLYAHVLVLKMKEQPQTGSVSGAGIRARLPFSRFIRQATTPGRRKAIAGVNGSCISFRMNPNAWVSRDALGAGDVHGRARQI